MTDHQTPGQHRTRWTREELEFLISEWDGSHDTTETIADLLGRTVHAVSQRWYELSWGHVDERKAPTFKPEPGDCHTVRVTHTVTRIEITGPICPECWTVLPCGTLTCDCRS